jgi:hypothetical protein
LGVLSGRRDPIERRCSRNPKCAVDARDALHYTAGR